MPNAIRTANVVGRKKRPRIPKILASFSMYYFPPIPPNPVHCQGSLTGFEVVTTC